MIAITTGRPADSMPLVDYFRDVYCPLREDELSRPACEVYRSAFSMLARHLGREATFADLKSETIAAFACWLIDHGRSPGTASTYRNAIVAMWRFAAKQGHVDHLPDMSMFREYRRHEIEEHRAARAAAEAPQPLGPHMTLRAFLVQYAMTATLSRNTISQTRLAVMSFDKSRSRRITLAELSDDLVDQWFQQRLASGIGKGFVVAQRIAVLSLWQAAFMAGLTATMSKIPVPVNRQRFKAPAGDSPIVPPNADAIFGENMTIGNLIYCFLDWQQGRITEIRLRGTRYYLCDFAEHCGKLTIAQFRPVLPRKLTHGLKGIRVGMDAALLWSRGSSSFSSGDRNRATTLVRQLPR